MTKHTTIRRIAILAMTVVMVLALTVPAFAAAANPTITITTTDQGSIGEDNRFAAYQIFTGTVEATDRQLSHIQWGTGVNSSGLVNAMKSDSTMGGEFTTAWNAWDSSTKAGRTEPELVAHFLADHTGYANAFARLAANYLEEAGKTESTKSGAEWKIQVPAPGYYLVVDNIADESGTSGSASSYILDVIADRSITLKASLPTLKKTVGEGAKGIISETGAASTFTYTLTATLPNNYAEYAKYELKFTDKVSKGITVDENSVQVKVDGTAIDLTEDYTVTMTPDTPGEENTLVVDIMDLKTSNPGLTNDKTIVVTYTGYLNEYATSGNTGNSNTATITYSNDPYDQSKTGTGAADGVKAYDFEINITKKDGSTDMAALAGAEFKLKKGSQYAKLTETGSADPKTYKVESWGDASAATAVTSGADGKINIAGLSTGTYILEETKAPAGYDAMEAVQFDIAGTVDGSGALTSVTCTLNSADATRTDASFTGADDGIIEATFINYKAAILPSTGGSGTTMLYVMGGVILVAGIALVLYMTKKKNNGSSEA